MARGRPPKDAQWRWVVVSACFVNMFILYGLYKMSGMLFVATMEVFHENRERAAWPYTLCNSVFQCVGVLAGVLAHNFGIRKSCLAGAVIGTIGTTACYFARGILWLTVFYGFVFGVGFGVISSLIPVIVNQYFKQNKSVATGIAYSGSTCGSLFLPVITEYILDTYGFRGSFLIIGGLVMNLLVSSALLRAPSSGETPRQKKLSPDEDNNVKLLPSADKSGAEEFVPLATLISTEDKMDYINLPTSEEVAARDHLHPSTTTLSVQKPSPVLETLMVIIGILRTPIFWILILSSMSFMYSVHSFYTIIIDFAIDKGVSGTDAKYLISAASLGSLSGRLFLGWVPDKNILSFKNHTMICMSVFTIIIGCFPLVESYTIFLVIAAIYGVLEGAIIIMFPVLATLYFGGERHAISFGLVQGLNGCASFARPSMIRFFRDTIGSYNGLFCTLAGMLTVGTSLWLFEPLCRPKQPALSTEHT